jgi:hypothetical protein
MVRLTFVALRDDVAFAIRLRSLLKYALRSCRLRCRVVEDVPPWKDDAAGRSPAIREAGAINGQPLEESKA